VIQRLIGFTVGVLVTVAILWWNHVDTTVAFTAAIIGAIAAFFWPIVVGWYLVRRHKAKQEDAISAEVSRQVAEQTKPPGH
jgi:Flp pilus assembly protein TadB